MNEQQLAAVKQALGALKKGTGWMEHGEIIAALQSIINQDALYKMAEDAVTIGLSYNDWPKIGCVNHDCEQCKAAQPDYAWPTIADYEKEVGFEVNDAFKAAWTMARTTNDLFNQMGENT
jgi:hypothetical protein